jgi:hypothetical protein
VSVGHMICLIYWGLKCVLVWIWPRRIDRGVCEAGLGVVGGGKVKLSAV